MSTSQNDCDGSTSSSGMNFLLFVCHAWATSIEVFLHRAPGERFLGFQAAAALLIVPVFLLGWRDYDVRPLLCFVPAYLLMCIVARIGMLRRRLRGERCHSRYTGWPRMMGPNAKVSEVTFKRFHEPLLAFVGGWLVRQFDAPLGTYLMLAAVCLFISVNACLMFDRVQDMNLNDVVIEQELKAKRFRKMRGDY